MLWYYATKFLSSNVMNEVCEKKPKSFKDKRKLDKWQRSNGDIIDVNNGVFSEVGLKVLDLPKEKKIHIIICVLTGIYIFNRIKKCLISSPNP